ncbi:MAG TPA: alpha/beta hydrolase [Allosphingosinicella sp.]|nr:alpha/beta hydrolase [Allosphingosinicella sp.]
MPLSSSFGLNPEFEAKFRDAGYVFNPSIVESTRILFKDGFDVSLPSGGRRLDDVAYGSHERQKLDLCIPAAAGRPIVLFVPGGGMTGGDKSMYAHIPAFFARKNYVGVVANYRLAPEFLFPSGAEDVADAIDWLVENADVHQGDVTSIFVIGQSAGAVHSASTVFDKRFHPKNLGSVKAAVLMSGVYEITPDHEGGNINLYFGNDAAELVDRSSSNHVEESTVPAIITVAEMEPAFFGLSAAALMHALTRRDKHAPQLVWLKGHNHLSPVLNMGNRGDELGDAIEAALRAYL